MSKKRVYEIARERGLETQQVLRRLKAANVDVKAAASTVSDEDIERVFGTPERVTPAQSGSLPSWLSASAAPVPKTTSKEAAESQAQRRQAHADAARKAREKAANQAKRLREQMLQKRADTEAAARAAAETKAAAALEAEDEVVAEAVEEPVEESTPEVVVEQPVDETPVADEPEVVDEPETVEPEAVVEDTSEPVAEAEPEAVVEEPAAEPEPVADAPAAAEPDTSQMSEAELRKHAQELARKRVAEANARRRAQMEVDRLERERQSKQRAKEEAEKPASPAPSRESRVAAAPSRESRTDDRGRGKGKGKRRVIIDAQASRRGSSAQSSGKGDRRNRGSNREAQVEIDPTIPVTIHAGATVKEFADALGVGSTEIIKIMMGLGDFVTITQSLSSDQMELAAEALERILEIKSAADEDEIPTFEDTDEELVARAPVVTIMGHVDHGKTSLLDAIRETKVAAGEAGGITQHIGAYQVAMADGRIVTFLDTPGHEAFTALRARGAKVTDEAVLVVAADDGVRPQTEEAIDHARAAEVPIVVAINKIDKEGANPDLVKSQLAERDLQPEEWGGKTVMVEVSAKQRQNLDELIEMILLQADVLELRANPNAEASGYVIESKLDPGRGPVATILVHRGTLKVGDVVVAGDSWGKVRAMHDFRGDRIQDAGPSVPVEIIGFNTVPSAGEFCQVVEKESVARERANRKAQRLKAELNLKKQRTMSLDDLFARIKEGEVRDLNLIVKADVAGSVDAIEQELGKIQHDEVQVRIIHSGVGGISGSDVMLAAASQAIILGFNVRPNAEARGTADKEGVDIRTYRVIYKLREDVENALSGLLSPEEVEETIGEAEVRQVFRSSRIGSIAGCMVTQGMIERNAQIRLLRGGTVIHEGEIDSLKRFKDDAKEVAQGFECGISIVGYNDIKEGDVIEAFVVKQVERDLSSELAAAKA